MEESNKADKATRTRGGFENMDPERRRELGRRGGQEVRRRYILTREQAQAYGRLGGLAAQANAMARKAAAKAVA